MGKIKENTILIDYSNDDVQLCFPGEDVPQGAVEVTVITVPLEIKIDLSDDEVQEFLKNIAACNNDESRLTVPLGTIILDLENKQIYMPGEEADISEVASLGASLKIPKSLDINQPGLKDLLLKFLKGEGEVISPQDYLTQ